VPSSSSTTKPATLNRDTGSRQENRWVEDNNDNDNDNNNDDDNDDIEFGDVEEDAIVEDEGGSEVRLDEERWQRAA